MEEDLGGSFWQEYSLPTSQIDLILEKETFTLEDLLLENEVIQECRHQNEKLVTFLVRPENVRQLVTLVVTLPSPAEAQRRREEEDPTIKFPYHASEILACNVNALLDALVNDEALLDLLFSVLDSPSVLSPHDIAYFRKVVVTLIENRFEALVSHLEKRPTVLPALCNHLYLHSIAEVLMGLLASPDSRKAPTFFANTAEEELEAEGHKEADVLKHERTVSLPSPSDSQADAWFCAGGGVQRLVARLDPKEMEVQPAELRARREDAAVNAAAVLVHIVSQHQFGTPSHIVAALHANEALESLISFTLSGHAVATRECLVVLTALVERGAVLPPEEKEEMNSLEQNAETLLDQFTQMATGGEQLDPEEEKLKYVSLPSPWVQPPREDEATTEEEKESPFPLRSQQRASDALLVFLLDKLSACVEDLSKLMVKVPPDTQPLQLQTGEPTIPLTATRLHAVELFTAMVHTYNAELWFALAESNGLVRLLDVFFGFPWSNFAHSLVETVVEAIADENCKGAEEMRNALFEKAKFFSRCVEAVRKNEEEEKECKTRKGNLAHVIRMASELQQRENSPTVGSYVMKASCDEDWAAFLKGTVKPQVELHSTVLGGLLPSVSAAQNPEFGRMLDLEAILGQNPASSEYFAKLVGRANLDLADGVTLALTVDGPPQRSPFGDGSSSDSEEGAGENDISFEADFGDFENADFSAEFEADFMNMQDGSSAAAPGEQEDLAFPAFEDS